MKVVVSMGLNVYLVWMMDERSTTTSSVVKGVKLCSCGFVGQRSVKCRSVEVKSVKENDWWILLIFSWKKCCKVCSCERLERMRKVEKRRKLSKTFMSVISKTAPV